MVHIDSRLRLWEGKHTNPFGSKGDAPARYLAQVQHALAVMELEGCEMSVLFGNSDWKSFSMERDQKYIDMLIENEATFWEHVQSDKPPPGDVVIDAGPSLELMRQVDMRASNLWNDAEATWVANRPHKILFDDAESKIKAMMAADMEFAFGNALACTRDKAGKLSLRLPTNKDLLRIQQMMEKADEGEGILDL